MRVVIHQPDFAPHLGFFHKLLDADVYVILDHVQMSPRGWVHRDKIKTANGEVWITVPVEQINRSTRISDVRIARDNPQYRRNICLLEENYRKSEHFRSIFCELRDIYCREWSTLVDLNIALLKYLMKCFDINIDCVRSSEMSVEGNKSQMLANIVKKVGGKVYLSGLGAKVYHDEAPFNDGGTLVVWQQFRHPVYKQQYGEFIPYLSSLDLLFNCGVDEARRVLREEC